MIETYYVFELFQITKKIDNEYSILMELSSKNRENTQEYNYHLNNLYNYIIESIDYCSQFSIDTLQIMLTNFNKYNQKYPEEYCYYYGINVISYVIDKKEIDLRKEQKPSEYNEELNYEESEEDDEETIDTYEYEDSEEIPIENKYYLLYPDNLDDQYDEAMNIIYIAATRKVLLSITNIQTTTKRESEYRNRLLKIYHTYSKYDFLSSNIPLELMAIKAHFNPFLIFVSTDTDFSSLYYNQAIDLIRTMYEQDIKDTNEKIICENLFNTLCLEEILNYLDLEKIIKLRNFCYDLETKYHSNHYGKLCLLKINNHLK